MARPIFIGRLYVSIRMLTYEERGAPARYGPGLPTSNLRLRPTGSPSAALAQPHLVTTTHWTTSFR